MKCLLMTLIVAAVMAVAVAVPAAAHDMPSAQTYTRTEAETLATQLGVSHTGINDITLAIRLSDRRRADFAAAVRSEVEDARDAYEESIPCGQERAMREFRTDHQSVISGTSFVVTVGTATPTGVGQLPSDYNPVSNGIVYSLQEAAAPCPEAFESSYSNFQGLLARARNFYSGENPEGIVTLAARDGSYLRRDGDSFTAVQAIYPLSSMRFNRYAYDRDEGALVPTQEG